jgi:hypothetical protein
MNPDFIIIGAQKAATTFLQSCLRDHPEVFMPKGETTFFETPDYELANGDIANLHEIFEGRSEKYFGIKRPNYIGKPEVPERIEHHLPDAKLIAVLRNPLDRAISAYHHNINYGFIPPIDFEQGMSMIINNSSYRNQYKRSPEIIEFGYYYKYLQKYSFYFKNNQMLILLHEDMISNKLDTIRKVYKFIGVNPNFIPHSLNSRPQAVVYNLTRLKFRSIRNRIIYNYNKDRTRIVSNKENTIYFILAKIITVIDLVFLAVIFKNNKPRISSSLKKKLFNIYKYDIEMLRKLIDRDLSNWKP